MAPAVFVDMKTVRADSFNRLNTGIAEFNRVLGGGLVPGSYLVLSGEPGAGKTTLATQIMVELSLAGRKVGYVSGEESEAQAKMRFERIGADPESAEFLMSIETSVERVVEAISERDFDLVIIDSIQTMFSEGLAGSPGSIAQVRECGSKLQRIAKESHTSILLIGQITKSGEMAGPKEFEHAVDVVLTFEGDRREQYRVLRADKNRFGSTDEIAVFEMTGAGLDAIEDPSKLFIEQHDSSFPGAVICPVLEGTRVMMCEIQALVRGSNSPMPARVARGLDQKRVQMLLAVLDQHLGFRAGSNDVFLNVSAGMKVEEPALDLAICTAIISAYKSRPVKDRTAVFGEVSLLGKLRPAAQSDRRKQEAARLGYQAIEPGRALKETIESVLGAEIETEDENPDEN